MLFRILIQLPKSIFNTRLPIIPFTKPLNLRKFNLQNRTYLYHTRRKENNKNYQSYFYNHDPYQYQNQYSYKRFNSSPQQNSKTLWQVLNDPSNRKWLYIILGGGAFFYVTHLEEAPVSSRRRFIWIPRSIELAIGKSSYESILNETRHNILPSNHPVSKKIETIFTRIIEAAAKDPSVNTTLIDGIDWKIHVVNDPRAPPNAFVLPGGKVFVFSSILGICKNDDGIATVLSHEFAHQLARHTAESLSKAPLYLMINLLLYSITGIQGVNGLLTDALLKMPASRQMETEADYIGLMIMARACFDPNEAVRVWERMAAFERQLKGQGPPLEFLSTHPASEKRIQNILSWSNKANALYEQSECNRYLGYYKPFQDVFMSPSSSTSFF